MDIYGILAFPANQSLSPVMHNAGFKALGIKAFYDFFEVAPEDLEGFMKKVRKENIKGLSVSAPHKQSIIRFLDSVDPVAEKIGAVNMVYRKNSSLIGTNVDWIGVEKAILEKTDMPNKKTVVLGAGGAAKAAVYALLKNDAWPITILNRTLSHAKKLADQFNCEYGDIDDFPSYNPKLVIQATSAGLNKKEGVELVPREFLHKDMVVMEMIYTPIETRIIKDARQVGAVTITGERMLLHQGAAAFEIWTSQKAPLKEMEEALNKALTDRPS